MRHPSTAKLLEIAGRFRMFAREAEDRRYFDKFRRGAECLEIEAMGYAVSGAVAEAMRRERGAKRRRALDRGKPEC